MRNFELGTKHKKFLNVVCFIIIPLLIIQFFVINDNFVFNGFESILDIVSLIIGSLIFGFFITGLIDTVLSYMVYTVTSIIEYIFFKSNSNHYTDVISWFVIVAINTYIFFFTFVGELAVAELFGVDVTLLFKIIGAYAIPYYYLVTYILDRIDLMVLSFVYTILLSTISLFILNTYFFNNNETNNIPIATNNLNTSNNFASVSTSLYNPYSPKKEQRSFNINKDNSKYIDLSITFNGATLISNNHVGNSWGVSAYVNGTNISRGETVDLSIKSNDILKLTAMAEEYDSIDDVGRKNKSIIISDIDLSKTNEYVLEVVVTENRGRYSGNSALWQFYFTITD